MPWRNILWWTAFTVAAIWIQSFLPGVDFLVPGLVVSLQEGRWSQTGWLALCWILIQEGAGSLPFGSALLWYGAVPLFYLMGRWLLESRNILFILILGLVLGAWHYGLVHMMASLQNYPVEQDRLLQESVLQAAFFPLSWVIVSRIRGEVSDDVFPV